ncbi:MAG: hypothetical protein H6990_00420 [Pseudomonadales bacterium]|nr:hypothetical protein [Pseudomonadales bacterium]
MLSIGATAGSDDEAGAQIKSLMGPEQYRAAGLDKLSTAEREALYQWLRTLQGGTAKQVEPAAERGSPAAAATTVPAPKATGTEANFQIKEATSGVATTAPPSTGRGMQASETAIEESFGLPEPVDPERAAYQLHATIEEPFRGWSGKTIFYLDNGQVWKQRSKGQQTYTGSDNRVVISQNRFGFYEMRLIDADRSVGVKRIR